MDDRDVRSSPTRSHTRWSPQRLWEGIGARTFQPTPKSLYAIAPAPSRIILTPVGDAEVLQAMRALAAKPLEIEEELLSTTLMRFAAMEWRAA